MHYETYTSAVHLYSAVIHTEGEEGGKTDLSCHPRGDDAVACKQRVRQGRLAWGRGGGGVCVSVCECV